MEIRKNAIWKNENLENWKFEKMKIWKNDIGEKLKQGKKEIGKLGDQEK